METEVITKRKLTINDILKNQKVKVVPIVRLGSPLGKGHDGEYMFTGAVFSTDLGIDRQKNQLKQILTREEQECFENEMQLKPGEMSFYRKDTPFWVKFRVKIQKEGIDLDLNNPVDYLKWLILKTDKRIAPSWEARLQSGEYRFALVNEGEEQKENATKLNLMKEVYKEFGKIEEDKFKMRNILRVAGKRVTTDDEEFLKSEISKLIDNNPKNFLAIVKDKQFNTKIFIERCLMANALERKAGGGYAIKGGESIGKDLNEAVEYLEHTLNQEVKLLLEAQIKNVK
jgi:hypothetical protein